MALVVVVGAAVVAMWLLAGEARAQAQLQVGFYAHSCPQAEVIVRDEVGRAVSAYPGFAAGLVRLHFHDCFVKGCDASVLLDSTANSTAEKDASPNKSLRGFEVIDAAKKRLEAACAGTVSCADILAFAARDSVVLAGGSPYGVPAGRRDGNVSAASDAQASLPPPTANVAHLTEAFAKNGLSQEDMVTLSGAHTVGVTHCSSFSARLHGYNATTGTGQDPAMDAAKAAELARQCPPGSPKAVPMDAGSPNTFDTGYFRALLANQGVLASDQTLTSDNATAALVAQNAGNVYLFVTRFGDAMVRMGGIRVLTGGDGQIRTNCRVVN
ncbi:peroxidase 5-like [Triticum dicoccoides]|uniref:peroxidase 5-like n=1 Tax=Triticum dicoccoides TaxID=85692 RepID=UPI000E7B4E52|nr:peroxidase 5-like [Triticum dicoccoides]